MKTKTYFCLLVVFLLPFFVTAQLPEFKTMLSEEWVKNAWRNESRITNDYDNNGKLLKQTTQEWDTISNHWDYVFRATNEYDGNNNLIKTTIADWDTISKQWKDMAISSYTFNPDGTTKDVLNKIWDVDNKTWVDFTKYAYTYDGARNVLTMTIQMDLGMGMMTFSKNTHTYNTSNQLIKTLYQAINLMTMQLGNESQMILEYNPDGTEYRSTQQNWNESSAIWENDTRSTNSYNSSKKFISELVESFTNGQWVNNQKTSQTYDNDGNVSEILTEEWNANLTAWGNSSKEMITYTSGNMYQVLSQDWDTVGKKWINYSRTTFEYGTTGIDQQLLTESRIRVFPNPFTGVIDIENTGLESASFRLFSAEGKMVYSFIMQDQRGRVDLSFLHNGTYYMVVNSGNIPKTIKLLKIR